VGAIHRANSVSIRQPDEYSAHTSLKMAGGAAKYENESEPSDARGC